jgi:integrase
MRAVLYFSVERELIERKVLARFKPFESREGERRVSRDSFSEEEIRALLAAARPHEQAFIGVLSFAGLWPGELHALDWSALDHEAGKLTVTRSWDCRGCRFVPSKTNAGQRVVPLSGWLVAELKGG